MQRTTVNTALGQEPKGQSIMVSGWVRTRRDSKGGFSFIELNDGSTLLNIQIIAANTLTNYTDEIIKLATGASIEVTGELVKSQGAGQAVEVKASAIKVFGGADETFPLQKKRHSFEYLREIAHLRPRSNTFSAVARIRNAASFAVHRFFQERGFLYVHTPIITASDCEGAGEMFKVTTLDIGKTATADELYAGDFFGQKAYLTVSGQLEGEIYACSMGNIYTFGPTFRAENSNTPRHLAEFWMIEPEMAFCELEDDIKTAVDFVKYLITDLLDNHKTDMEFFNKFIDNSLIERLSATASADFKVLTYTEAVEIITRSGKTWEYPVKWGSNLQAEHEKYLTEEVFKGPVVVINYPRVIKPFYMYVNDDGKTVRAMDILVPHIGEIIGGSQREHRLDVLYERMDELKMERLAYWWYVELRKYGTVPHAGFGLGLERFLLYATGMQNIRDVIPFPRTPGSAKF